MLASGAVNLQKLTELGFKAGGSQGLKYAESMARIVSSIPGLNAELNRLSTAQGNLTDLTAGATEVLKNFGVEGLGVYTKMRMAALGIKDTSDEFRTFGNIADGFKKSFSEAMRGAAEGIGGFLRVFGPGGQQIIGQMAGMAGVAGAVRVATSQLTQHGMSYFAGRTEARTDIAQRIGAYRAIRAQAGAEGAEVSVPADIAARVARAPTGVTGAGGSVFNVATAVINVGSASGGAAGIAGGVADARRASQAAVTNVTWSAESAKSLRRLESTMVLQNTANIFGFAAAAAAPLMGAIPGKTGEVLGAGLSGFGIGAQIAAGLAPVMGPFAAVIPLLTTAIPVIGALMPKKETPKEGWDKLMKEARARAESFAESQGKRGVDVQLAGATTVAAQASSHFRAIGQYGGVKGAQEQVKSWEKDIDDINKKFNPLIDTMMKTDVEAQKVRDTWQEWENAVKGAQDNIDSLNLSLAQAGSMVNTEVLAFKQIRTFQRDIATREAARVGINEALYAREVNIYGITSKSRDILDEEKRAYQEQLTMAEARVVTAREQLKGHETETDRVQEVSESEQNLTQVKSRGAQLVTQSMATEIEFSQRRQQNLQTEMSMYQKMGFRDPTAVSQRAVQLAQERAGALKAAEDAVRSLLKEGRDPRGREVTTAQQQVTNLRSELVDALDMTRRTWEDAFTEQLIGMPSGSYLMPSGPSGFDIFGGAYMTGMAPGARGRGGAGFGTYTGEMQTRLGLQGTGKNGAEILLEQVVNIMSSMQSGLKLEIADPTTAWLRSTSAVGDLVTGFMRDAMR